MEIIWKSNSKLVLCIPRTLSIKIRAKNKFLSTYSVITRTVATRIQVGKQLNNSNGTKVFNAERLDFSPFDRKPRSRIKCSGQCDNTINILIVSLIYFIFPPLPCEKPWRVYLLTEFVNKYREKLYGNCRVLIETFYIYSIQSVDSFRDY